jgi:hypothetical protein
MRCSDKERLATVICRCQWQVLVVNMFMLVVLSLLKGALHLRSSLPFLAMGDRPKRLKLDDRCDDLDVLRKLLHTGGVSMVGLRKLISKMKTAGFTAETLHGRRILSEANSERLPQ